MNDFWAMGGYAVFVWTSYGLAAVTLGGLIGVTLWQRRMARARWNSLKEAKQ